MLANLEHQCDQPDDTEGDVQTVRADQRKEGREERRTLRCRAFVDQVVELVKFNTQEGEAEKAGNTEPDERRFDLLLFRFQHGKAIGDR
ncbi:hypothetical protein D3C80_2012190 [compost metagenome]